MDLFSLIGEDNLESRSNNSFDLSSDLDDILNNMSIDYSKTGYVICERQNFRTDSLFEELKKVYKMDMVCLSKNEIPVFKDTLFFVVDVTDFTSTKMLQKILSAIQSAALKYKIPIFVIGEQEDIVRLNTQLRRSEVNIIEFERPINIKQCLEDIDTTLTTASVFNTKKHILVVDDSITFLKLVQKMLEKKYRVTVVPSALECIKTLVGLNEKPDLIIIDYMMPTCNGLILCKMLREDESTKDIPIIFLSGNNDVNEIIKVMPMVDGYMLKSEPITGLDAYLEKIFEQKDKEKKFKDKHKRKVIA